MPYIAFDRRINLGGELRAYDDELPLLFDVGIRSVVCLLNIPSDSRVFESAGFEFRCWPVANGLAPDFTQTKALVEFVDSCRARRKPVGVYCEAGLGRTGTVIASYLIYKGSTAQEAIGLIRLKEPAAIETRQQLDFLTRLEKLRSSNGFVGGRLTE